MTATEQSQLDRIEEMLTRLHCLLDNKVSRNEQAKIDLENQQRADAAHQRMLQRRSRQ